MQYSSYGPLELAKLAVALRSGRAAAGWTQQEFADKLEVAKSTIARVETLEMTVRAEFLMRAISVLKEAGVELDFLSDKGLSIHISIKGIEEAAQRLADEDRRRSDRKKKG